MNCSTPGLPVHHQLSEFTQTHASSRWCHPAISSSVAPFFSCPQSGSFPMSQLFAWGGQSIGPSASASLLPVNIQDWFPLGLTGPRDSQESSTDFKSVNALVLSFLHSHPYMTMGKILALTRQTFVDKVMSLLFNMLSRFVIAFLPRSKCLLLSWL